MRQCSRCKEWKPLTDFRKRGEKNRNHLASWCKPCQSAYRLEYAKNNREKEKARKAKWTKENREHVLEYQRKWSDTDRVRERKHKYYEANADKWSRWRRLFRQNNPEKHREYVNNHRAKKKANGGTISSKEWQWLKEYYDYTCLCCGRKEPEIELTLDHVLPLDSGGKNVIKNAQPLCRSCNSRKGTKHIDYRPIMTLL